jgi:hypothetical protein
VRYKREFNRTYSGEELTAAFHSFSGSIHRLGCESRTQTITLCMNACMYVYMQNCVCMCCAHTHTRTRAYVMNACIVICVYMHTYIQIIHAYRSYMHTYDTEIRMIHACTYEFNFMGAPYVHSAQIFCAHRPQHMHTRTHTFTHIHGNTKSFHPHLSRSVLSKSKSSDRKVKLSEDLGSGGARLAPSTMGACMDAAAGLEQQIDDSALVLSVNELADISQGA